MGQTITKQTLDPDVPAVISYATASSTDGTWDNVGSGFRTLVISNTSTDTTHTATVDSQTDCDQNNDHDLSATIAPETIKEFGPFNQARFNDSDGYVNYELDSTADLEIAVIETPVV